MNPQTYITTNRPVKFIGAFTIDPPLAPQHLAYLQKFCRTCRMKRDPLAAALLPDEIRIRTGLGVGAEGAYCLGGVGDWGQDLDSSVIDANTPPLGQPSLWCEWFPAQANMLVWSGEDIDGEFTLHHVEWLRYLISHFFESWGYVLNGTITKENGSITEITVRENSILFPDTAASPGICLDLDVLAAELEAIAEFVRPRKDGTTLMPPQELHARLLAVAKQLKTHAERKH